MSLSPKVLGAFATLATPTSENVFESNAKFGDMFREAQREALKAAQKAIVTELQGVASNMADTKLQLAQTGIALRRQAADADAAVAAIDLAFRYGEVTDNYLPLLSVLGTVSAHDYSAVGLSKTEWEELCTIPEGWTGAAPVVA